MGDDWRASVARVCKFSQLSITWNLCCLTNSLSLTHSVPYGSPTHRSLSSGMWNGVTPLARQSSDFLQGLPSSWHGFHPAGCKVFWIVFHLPFTPICSTQFKYICPIILTHGEVMWICLDCVSKSLPCECRKKEVAPKKGFNLLQIISH